MKRVLLSLAVILFGLLAVLSTAVAESSADMGSRGADTLASGQFEQAVSAWSDALAKARASGDTEGEIDSLTYRSIAYQELGYIQLALADLKQARRLASQAGPSQSGQGARIAAIDSRIGTALAALGANDEAMAALTASLGAGDGDGENPAVAAAALNGMGGVLHARRDFSGSLAAYRQSAEKARDAGDSDLAATARINAARELMALGDRTGEAEIELKEAAVSLDALPDGHRKAFLLVGHAVVAMSVQEKRARSVPGEIQRIQGSLHQAADMAERLGDRRTLSFAEGYLGQFHAGHGRLDEAQAMFRRAIFHAQEISSPDLLFRWHWQTGRLLDRRGDLSGAIQAYQRSVRNLQRIRPDLAQASGGGGQSFQNTVGPVLLGLSDLLLRRAPLQRDPAARQADLIAARDAVERFKTAELEDYFQDDCVASLQAKATAIDRLEPRTASLYPILLPDRTELLISLDDGLKQVTVPVGATEITRAAHGLRYQLERRTTSRFMADATKLYDWLVRPVADELDRRHIETLVVVPDGSLRSIPFAALHDGKRFLIEKYAVSVTQGLSLLEPRPLSVRKSTMLLAGLTDAVQGFPALPHIEEELSDISQLYGGTVLYNRDFLKQSLRDRLREAPYSIVHIASHGKFESDSRNSFVLTFDGKLTMDDLERYIKFNEYSVLPLELLTLSACQTAAGDDRATLGLAGVAIKAGARSALATLWLINDQAAELLITDFYRHLADPALNKAQALQQAQLTLLKDNRYRHPGFWAAFLLIGNWL
jgi:CHAT domain-containing protein